MYTKHCNKIIIMLNAIIKLLGQKDEFSLTSARTMVLLQLLWFVNYQILHLLKTVHEHVGIYTCV